MIWRMTIPHELSLDPDFYWHYNTIVRRGGPKQA